LGTEKRKTNELATNAEKPSNDIAMPVCPKCKDESSFSTLKKNKGDRICDECGREF
jgi:transposase-like protein